MRTRKRLLALLLVALLVFGVLFGFSSVFLLVRYPGHTCCGERCQLCVVLSAVDALLHQSGVLLGTVLLGAVLLVGCVGCMKRARICRLPVRTPITLKTKMLN